MPESVPELPNRGRRRALSAVIVIVIGLQAFTGLKVGCPPKTFAALEPLRVACPPLLWPFIDYPMYQRSFPEGTVVSDYAVIAELADGRRVEVRPGDVGLSPVRFRRAGVERLLYDQRGGIRQLALRCREAFGDVTGLALEHRPVRILRDHLEPLPVEVARRVAVDAAGLPR